LERLKKLDTWGGKNKGACLCVVIWHGINWIKDPQSDVGKKKGKKKTFKTAKGESDHLLENKKGRRKRQE